MVRDENGLADGHAVADSAGGVGEDDRARARRDGRANGVHDSSQFVPLVCVSAALQ